MQPIVENLPTLTVREIEALIIQKSLDLKQKYLQRGNLVYELYGVMLHSGGAHGGHYSAYIKDFENAGVEGLESENCWFHFNDSFVKKISITELVSAFGTVRNARTAGNHLNAYMLLYRLVQTTNQIKHIPLSEISAELIEDVRSQSKEMR